ncbi:hypothetical protein MSAN_01551600 [Mycena sanguinolenta]|uniref:Uncharacterized protein n=1 Tax=Mycena sanguinolenta TaxID=230812 RepID=A0A8H7CUX4_9AGAR|nr:hypothetical protein MSAN_01551600 [Mycena sanguinolenta]
MALRSFTVYCDTPVDAAVDTKPSQASKATVLGSIMPNPNVPAASTTSLASTAEKENLHPITGERCGAVSDSSANKKRKTNVLATKTVAVKKQKESKEDKAEGKKARSASSSAGKAKKDGKSTRKTAKKPSRRVSPLPKLDEEDVAVRDRLMQADIASRCYELTVSPLADVTQAYDAGFDVNSLLAGFTSEDSVKFQKATSTEPELRDYFSPSHSSGSSARVTPPLGASAQETKVFNTPERRHIYSAFTFTTPSPSSERFRQASRASSPTVPRLELPSATSA